MAGSQRQALFATRTSASNTVAAVPRAACGSGLRGSMSRTGNPHDNAQVQLFIKTLRLEEGRLHAYATMQDVVERRHSALGCLPSTEYEARHAQSGA